MCSRTPVTKRMRQKITNEEPVVKVIGVGPTGRNIIASVSKVVKTALSKICVIQLDGKKCLGPEEFYSKVKFVEVDSKIDTQRLARKIKNSDTRIDMVITTGCTGCEDREQKVC